MARTKSLQVLRRALDDSGVAGFEGLWEQWMARSERGLMIVGSIRRVLAINELAREMLSFRDRVPTPLAEVIPDLDLGAAVGRVFHDRATSTYETYTPHPDRLLNFHLAPVLTESGEPAFIVVSILDVTRLRHLETVRRDFVANVSHELRTPLTSIGLLVETLRNGALEDTDAAQHFLKRIEVEVMAMTRLVAELLELSRLESGRLALQILPIDVRSLIERVVTRLAPTAVDKQIEVKCDIQNNLPAARADSDRLEQVLLNLTHNAIKFTPSGGQVSLRAGRSGLGILVEISDSGIGMSGDEVSRIFERFYKADRGRSREEGTGLGLSIARHILELHGSKLQVVSGPGHGSRFSFRLPIE